LSELVLVVGVGRSGTSLLAGILGQLGFHIPQPEIEADETNPRGFGEPRWVVDFHTPLMEKVRVRVFDSRPIAFEKTHAAGAEPEVRERLREWLRGELDQAEAVVIKDPRVTWFLPLWSSAAEDVGTRPSLVTMLRHPAEILLSAKRSYGDWQSDASRATSWINEMLETELATRGQARAFVRYEDLLADWARELRRVGAALDLAALRDLDQTKHPQVDGFVDPGLHRNRGSWDDLSAPPRVRDLAERVWSQLQLLAEPAADAAVAAELDALREEYHALYAEAEQIAQSSVAAVRPRKRPAKAPAPAAQGAPASAKPSLRVRLARRVPARYRRRLRSAVGSLRRS
jgi:hypothetical protein